MNTLTLNFRLWQHINIKRRRQIILLTVLLVIVSIAEIASIGAVLPFLMIITDPSHVSENRWLSMVVQFFSISNHRQAILLFTVIFSLVAIISGVVRLLGLWYTNKIAFGIGTDLSLLAYERSLYQPYCYQINRNSGEVISGIATKVNSVIYTTLIPALNMLSSLFLVGTVWIALLIVNPIAAILVLFVVLIVYGFLAIVNNKRLFEDSKLIAAGATQVVKTMQEALSGIREVILTCSQSFYLERYRKADTSLRAAQARSAFISSSPRFIVEPIGFVLLAFTIYVMTDRHDFIREAVPFLGTLILGAQRLLPIIQQANSSRSTIISGNASLHDVIMLLDQPKIKVDNKKQSLQINLSRSVFLKDVSYRYSEDGPWIINAVNLEIRRGEKIGLIGKTGSGKTTLMDIFMGLLRPTQGCVLVDGMVLKDEDLDRWYNSIGHVSQTLFVADSSIAENIAFGVPREQIDYLKVYNAARKAQIDDVIDKLPNKYNTRVGEFGVKLSGGQRQRIAIARALYRDVAVLILDEATSALDCSTENSVMESIDEIGQELTIVVVAHRVDTLKKCNRIIEIENGSVKWVGYFDQIENRNRELKYH